MERRGRGASTGSSGHARCAPGQTRRGTEVAARRGAPGGSLTWLKAADDRPALLTDPIEDPGVATVAVAKNETQERPRPCRHVVAWPLRVLRVLDHLARAEEALACRRLWSGGFRLRNRLLMRLSHGWPLSVD